MDKTAEQNAILMQTAKQASMGAFACMSGFKVGAALLVQDEAGQEHIVKGANYETQNYRSVCAEKHALQTAHLNYPDCKMLKIAVYSAQSFEELFPCGDCRQALYEANPNFEILCGRSNGEFKQFSIADLLPYGFRLQNSSVSDICLSPIQAQIREYIVHFPVLMNKLALLENLQGLIIVGSPVRAFKLANHFNQNFKLKTSCYCHIAGGETDREYSLFITEENNLKIGIASHGIGSAGIEIILAEIMALNALANSNHKPSIKAVIRSGTRGTIADVPLGSIALTTKAYNENNCNFPNAKLTATLKETAPELLEGACLSAQFFWTGQGRTPFPLIGQIDEKDNENYLRNWQAKGIKWIEMEDYYLNYFAQKFNIASAALGVVVAKRYQAETDSFVLSYDAGTKKDKELIPAEIAYRALKAFLV